MAIKYRQSPKSIGKSPGSSCLKGFFSGNRKVPMKIVYISYATIPSRTANSIQVMKMCQAMALNGHKVVLLVPDKKSESEKGISDIYHFYGVKNCFEIRKIFCPLIKEKTLIFSFRATYIAKKLKSDIIYTRSILAGLVASFYGVPTICELISVNYFSLLTTIKIPGSPLYTKL